jgi:hypothetical protein
MALAFLLALLPQFMRDGLDDLAWPLAGGAAFVAGDMVAQVAAVLFGTAAIHALGTGARWIERGAAAALVGFALAAALAPMQGSLAPPAVAAKTVPRSACPVGGCFGRDPPWLVGLPHAAPGAP